MLSSRRGTGTAPSGRRRLRDAAPFTSSQRVQLQACCISHLLYYFPFAPRAPLPGGGCEPQCCHALHRTSAVPSPFPARSDCAAAAEAGDFVTQASAFRAREVKQVKYSSPPASLPPLCKCLSCTGASTGAAEALPQEPASAGRSDAPGNRRQLSHVGSQLLFLF